MRAKIPTARETPAEARRIADRIVAELERTTPNVPGLRALRRQFTSELQDADRDTILACALDLIGRARFGRFVAYELVHHHEPTLASLTAAEIETLGDGIRSWGDVDTFGCYISGPAWHLDRIDGETVARWARSDDRWWRRAALVSTVPLNSRTRVGPRSTARTLAICRLLLADRDDMVVKAMSWALRALSVRDPDAASKFLDKHRETLAPRVIREVRNKLTTGVKTPRKARSSNHR